MSIKAVIKHVNEIGVKETLDIHKQRKENRSLPPTPPGMSSAEKKDFKDLKEAAAFQAALEQQKLAEQSDTDRPILDLQAALLQQMTLLADQETITLLTDELLKLEDENETYKHRLKNLYIKELLPKMYKLYASQPVEDKVVFMQPRNGLNQSCRYCFNKLKEQGKYEVKLCELKRGKVPTVMYYSNALEFIREMATAKAVFVHESNDLLGYVDIRPETKVVQLWHGCGVIKSIGMSNAGKPDFKTLEEYREFPEYNKYDIVTIASEAFRWIFEEFMGLEKGDPVIQPIGVSRTDEFFDEEYIENCFAKLRENVPQSEGKKIILYAPTYRGVDPDRVAPDALDIEKFADALSDDYILIIKQHQTAKDLPEIPEKYRDKFAFDMTRGRGMNINELMTVSDICISDYSSVVYEFALFERPIIFFTFDIDKYSGERGLYYSYEELAEGGPMFTTNDEMIDYIKNIDTRFDKEKVKRYKEKYMSACDGHATERIIKFIEG